MTRLSIAVVLIALLVPPPAVGQELISGRARAVDGGTLVIGKVTIALSGVAAPGLRHSCREWIGRHQRAYPCGLHAKAFLASMLAGHPASCVITPRRRGSALRGRCYANGTDLGEALVGAGWAIAAGRRSKQYLSVQETARAAQRGMWAGTFDLGSDGRPRLPRRPR